MTCGFVARNTPDAAVIEVIRADITMLEVDAIVNAANSALAGGGGVDGAIHRAAGSELVAASRKLAPCPTGDARITPGFRLPARYVIHAVGPVWHGGTEGEDGLLASCYRRAVELAQANSLESIAFPAISTGVYRFPAGRAASIAVSATAQALAAAPPLTRIIFCCFSKESAKLHEQALADIGSPCAD